MQTSLEKLQSAQKQAMENRPKVGGFPYLAETLYQAGVKRNVWTLPSCQSVYYMEDAEVIQMGKPLVEESTHIPAFNESALIEALRADQAGKTTFTEFLQSAWNAGVLWYTVDFEKREVIYGGSKGESYSESYPKVVLS